MAPRLTYAREAWESAKHTNGKRKQGVTGNAALEFSHKTDNTMAGPNQVVLVYPLGTHWPVFQTEY